MPVNDVPQHLVRTLSRAKFEQLADNLIRATIEPCRLALKDAGYSVSDIDEVILVGGSTRIPAIQNVVRDFFGKEPSKGVNPDEVVAIGASIQGGVLTGEVTDVLLVDVIPLSLGIETMGGVMTKLIESNTTIPTRKTEIFSTAADNQTSVEIHVLQGERPMASQNKTIGRFILDNIPLAPRGVPKIQVVFDIDSNGILNVSAKDEGTGKSQSIRIEASSGLTDEEIERMKKEAEENAESDKKERERIDYMNKCESMVFQTERQLDEYKDKDVLTQEDKDYFNAKIEEFKKMKEENDYTKFDELSEEVNKKWWDISAKMYAKSNPNGENTQGFSAEQFQDMFTKAQQANGGQAQDASPVDESSVDNQVY